ncbi:hypothetical protein H0X06_01885 [Candidatus Dependentiae bacterium]|nr:hypothetical protein [Candidatus Dependentiae bacterium]
MKRTTFLSLCAAATLGATIKGMESYKTTSESSNTLVGERETYTTISHTTTLVDELHIPIILYVIKGAPSGEALSNLKNYNSTCKKNFLILKDKKIAHTLIDYMIRYTRGFTIASLDQLLSVLDTEKVTIYKNNMIAGKKIHDIFKNCKEKAEWTEALTTLNSLKTDPLSYQVVDSRWIDDSTKDKTILTVGQNNLIQDEDLLIQNNLLTEALILDAPLTVICLLIDLKADPNLIHSGPSAVCVAMKQFLATKDEGLKKDLQEKIDCLVKAEGDLDYCYFVTLEANGIPFKAAICPLTMAVESCELEKVQFLIAQGVKNLIPDALLIAALSSLQQESFIEILKALLKTSSNVNACPRAFNLPILHTLISLSQPTNIEKMIPVIDILLEKVDPEFRPSGGATALELALTLGNEKLSTHLQNKGASLPLATQLNPYSPLLQLLVKREKAEDEDIKKQLFAEYKNLITTFKLDIQSDFKLVLLAVQFLDFEVLAYLFEQGANANVSLSLETPTYGSISSFLHFMVAIYKEVSVFMQIDTTKVKAIITLLIYNGAPKNMVNKEGKTVSEKAREFGFEEIATLIDSCIPLQEQPLLKTIIAFLETDTKLEKNLLLEKIEELMANEDIKADLKKNFLPLMHAVLHLKIKLLKVLLKCEAPADILFSIKYENYGNTNSMLHLLVYIVHKSKCKFEEKPTLGAEAYRYIFTKATRIVALLIDNGTPKERLNSEGKTAAQRARELGMEDFAEFIEGYGL